VGLKSGMNPFVCGPNKFGPHFARHLKHQHRGYGDTFYIDEVFVKIRGQQKYLWRAVDQDGEVVDIFL
jgi:putative transposase